MNQLPKKIEVLEYNKTCGETYLGSSIMLVDENMKEICRLEKGTIQEKQIANLWQHSIELLDFAKKIVEEYDVWSLDDLKKIIEKIERY